MLLMAWLAMRVLMGSETTGRHTIGAHPVELILIGVVAGLAILTRPVAICMLASIFIGFYVMDRHDLRRNFLKISLITVTAAVIVVPWAVRNTVAVGATTLQTSSGVVLWIGHNPQATGALMPPPHIPGINAGARPGAGPNATEAEANAAYTSAAIDSFLNNPFRALTLVPRKMFELWGGHRHAVSHSTRKSERAIPGVILDILPILTQGYLVLLLLLVIAAFGIKQSLMRWLKGSGVILTGTFVGWNVYHAMNFGSGRYHVPLEPILAIFAASAISAIILTTKNSAPNS
jgi:4-amino-4-deoxy-L-arabinose transferase-like glycosyltransferase